ncbi:MAG: hypothetical protein Q7R32_06455 [Dehalococcoidia bacterium]|nr:hypothetical protein [Dehalococcoidia bacterium]
MTAKVIVFVADRGDQRFGEVSVFDSSGEAERLLETLLEAGYDQQRIHVFSGAEMEARVSHRPVVALVTGDQEEVSESAAPDGLVDQTEAGVGEEGGSEAEPAHRWNGPLPGKVPARLFEMMPELLH